MTHQTTDSILKNPRLPTMPAVAMEVLKLTQQPQTDLKEIARAIQNDQALSARIIRTVNSSYFGLARPCGSINQAIVYLGVNAVKMLALGFSLVHSVRDDDEWHVTFDFIDYWRRSMHSAAAARAIARITKSCDPEEAFLTALLQDIGMIAFLRAYGDIYLQAIDLTEGVHSNLPAIEQRALQTDHPSIGATLIERWNLPDEIVQAVRFHHNADAAPPKWRQTARTVQLACEAAAITVLDGQDDAIKESLESFKANGRAWFSLTDAQLANLLETMTSTSAELADLFKVDLGGPAAVDEILCRAEDAQLMQHIALEEKCRAAQQPTPPNLQPH